MLKGIETYIDSKEPNLSRLRYHILYLIYRLATIDIDYRIIEDCCKNNTNLNDLEEAEVKPILETINGIYSNLYQINNTENINMVISYIIEVIKSNYSSLVNIRTKADERILYKAVEKLKRVRIVPVFDNFKDYFTKSIDEIIKK